MAAKQQSTVETEPNGSAPDADKFIVIDPHAQARRQIAQRMRYLAQHPLDKSPRAGGYYLDADGKGAHDAEGRKLAIRPEDEGLAEELRRMTEARFRVLAPAAAAGDSPEEIVERDRAARLAAAERAAMPVAPQQ